MRQNDQVSPNKGEGDEDPVEPEGWQHDLRGRDSQHWTQEGDNMKTRLGTLKDIIRAIRSTKGLEIHMHTELWGSLKVTKSVAIAAVRSAEGDYTRRISGTLSPADDVLPAMLSLYADMI